MQIAKKREDENYEIEIREKRLIKTCKELQKRLLN